MNPTNIADNKLKVKKIRLLPLILIITGVFIVAGAGLIIYNILNDVLVTSEEYAELLIDTVEDMDLPYEIKIKLTQTDSPAEILTEINKSLDIGRKISKSQFISREQAAFMTDAFLKYIGIDYRQSPDTLTFVPDFISRTVYENEILVNVNDNIDLMKLNSYYTLKSINTNDLSERAKKEIEDTYPVTKKTSIYVFDPVAVQKERQDVLELLIKYSTLTDVNIAQMYITYGMIQRYMPVISFEQVYLEELPEMSGAGEATKSIIEGAYFKTTLADENITQTERDYIINRYKEKYAVILFYRQLAEEVTEEQKEEIRDVLSQHSEIQKDPDDQYESFDSEYGIPTMISWQKYDEMIQMCSDDDIVFINTYYLPRVISPYNELYEFNIPDDDQIEVYKMKSELNLNIEEQIRIDTYGFAALNKHTAALVEIYPQCDYEDIGKISAWAKESVEMTYKTGIMSDLNNGNFSPSENITLTQAEKIMNNIMCGVIVY